MIRVLLADDQALVRAGFRLILDAEADIEVVGEAADGEEALEQARELGPDIVLMDIRMPKLNGIDATKRLLADNTGARVLMLTTFDLDEYVIDAFRAGASGFLLKTAPRHQLVAGVRTVHEGDAFLAPTSTRRLIEEFARAPETAPALELLSADLHCHVQGAEDDHDRGRHRAVRRCDRHLRRGGQRVGGRAPQRRRQLRPAAPSGRRGRHGHRDGQADVLSSAGRARSREAR